MHPPKNPAKRQTFLLPRPVKGPVAPVNMNAERIKQSGASETALGKGPHAPLPITSFRGEAAVAQTLRWVSTAALYANKDRQEKAQKTPEVQSALVAGRLVLGTNAQDDGHLPEALKATIAAARALQVPAAVPVEASSPHFKHDIHATNAQTHRHIQALSDFTSQDHPLFREMVGETQQYYGAHISRHEAILQQDPKNAHSIKRLATYRDRAARTVQSLNQVRVALRDGFIDMAPPLGNTAKSSGHAEQRIIEYANANANADAFHGSSQKARQAAGMMARPRTNIVLAGTKPPCETCFETEKARHAVAQQERQAGHEISPLRIVRFENPVYKVGNLFGPPPFTVSNDSRVAVATQTSMDGRLTAPHPTYSSATRGASPPRARPRPDEEH